MNSEPRTPGAKNLTDIIYISKMHKITKEQYILSIDSIQDSSLHPDKSGFRSECVTSVILTLMI